MVTLVLSWLSSWQFYGQKTQNYSGDSTGDVSDGVVYLADVALGRVAVRPQAHALRVVQAQAQPALQRGDQPRDALATDGTRPTRLRVQRGRHKWQVAASSVKRTPLERTGKEKDKTFQKWLQNFQYHS